MKRSTLTCPVPGCRAADPRTQRPAPQPAGSGCPLCGGSGTVDERVGDLWQAGIVLPDATDEDFRSAPNLWEP